MNTLTRTSMTVAVAIVLGFAATAANPLLKEFEDAFVALSEQVRPSVVEITAHGSAPPGEGEERIDIFRFFRGPEENEEERPRRRERPASTGSGFIYDSAGHIITNNHVVENAGRISVELWDGKKRDATLVGTDPSSDLAVIKIDPEGLNLRPVAIGNSDNLKVGQFAIAIGSPRGQTGSLSFGHISGLAREDLRLPDPKLRFQSFIQTDAAINLGNSGGPLCNIDGEVIGVNIAIAYGANSIGFAIPVNRVKEIVPQLISLGKVVRGWLGVGIKDVAVKAADMGQEVEDYVEAYNLPDERGALIESVTWEGPAESSDLRLNDLVRSIDGVLVEDTTALINIISAKVPGSHVSLQIWRGGEAQDIDVVIGEFPGLQTGLYGTAYLGIHVSPADAIWAERLRINEDDFPSRLLIPMVVPESPGHKAGLRAGDFIVEIAQKPVSDRDSFRDLLRRNARPGKTLLFKIQRPGAEAEAKFLQVPDDFSMDR